MAMLAPVLCAASLAVVGADEGPRFEASAGAGGGYDSNVALASPGSDVPSFGTATTSAWLDGGLSFDVGDAMRLYAGLRYDGLLALDANDLSYNAFGADLSFAYEITDWLAAIVSPTVGYAFYGDPARSGVKADGRVMLRFLPWTWLSVRVGYARSQIWASDDVFSLATDRVLAGAEAHLARRTYLAVGYSLSIGDQVFYLPESIAESSPVRGRSSSHRGGGRFSTIVPYKASATENAVSTRLEQGLWKDLYVAVTYEYTLGSSQEGEYVVHSFYGSVGYRF